MALAQPRYAMTRLWAAGLALALTAALSGCATTDWAVLGGTKVPNVCQMVATWQGSVTYSPDPANNGRPGPGMAGRLYLFGPQLAHPIQGDGALSVELYDESNPQQAQQAQQLPLERWQIDPATLQRLGKQDMIGWGYTVYLPWTRTSPDLTKMTKVKLRMCYQPAKGTPIFTENVVSLFHANGQVSVQHKQTPVTLTKGK